MTWATVCRICIKTHIVVLVGKSFVVFYFALATGKQVVELSRTATVDARYNILQVLHGVDGTFSALPS